MSKTFFTFGKNSDIYSKQQIKMEAVKEKTMTVEITESQYNHIQEVLKMNKPSRTRLTQSEKNMIYLMASNWQGSFSTDEEEDKLLESIRKKLK